MPGPDGRLTPQDIEAIRSRLRFARPRDLPDKHVCPYCHNDEWIMGQHIVVDDIPDSTATERQPFVPYVVFFCTRCAYSMRFNAVMMGLYQPEDQLPPPVLQTAHPQVGGEVRHGR